ncbi:MAG: gentisate 1,2-dioxygenase [Proteobacteria bacterium]|nr:MAG: gentisate 1,2-dioxygenase [Pseudomonadota bacterium]
MSLDKPASVNPQRLAFYDRIDGDNYAALWQVLSSIITMEPKSQCQPNLWHYDKAREYLMEAGGLISASEAERRVLILENPGLHGQSRITTSLYAGLQLVLPGEVAPAHRHSQSALRFIVEGSGGHTAVNGERTMMEVGDFVITPPWTWHDHGNDSSEPMIWLDGLDIPMVSFFDASFAEGYGEDQQPVTRETGDSLARYGANMLPVDYDSNSPVSPVFNYPYARTRESLDVMRRQDEWDPCHGLKMRYVNPNTGGFAMPTIAAFMQLLPASFATARYRSTDATVFSVVEGTGRSEVDGVVLPWGPKDIFVAPSWKWVTHHPDSDAVLFSFSDRVAQQKLGLWREQRGDVSA